MIMRSPAERITFLRLQGSKEFHIPLNDCSQDSTAIRQGQRAKGKRQKATATMQQKLQRQPQTSMNDYERGAGSGELGARSFWPTFRWLRRAVCLRSCSWLYILYIARIYRIYLGRGAPRQTPWTRGNCIKYATKGGRSGKYTYSWAKSRRKEKRANRWGFLLSSFIFPFFFRLGKCGVQSGSTENCAAQQNNVQNL